MRLQTIEVRRPELSVRLEPVIEILKRLGTDAIEATLRIGANVDESRISQNPKMF
jgi:hypothetical protein